MELPIENSLIKEDRVREGPHDWKTKCHYSQWPTELQSTILPT